MTGIALSEGQRMFGTDPAAYDRARPEYPQKLYKHLIDRCGLREGTSAFEVGAGTGLATKHLLALGLRPLLAIEPDPRLFAYLQRAIQSPHLQLLQSSFEDASMEPANFDFGFAATSFHWLQQSTALAKAHAVLKPGGWWAMWWTHFGSNEEDDVYHATKHIELYSGTPVGPYGSSGVAFALDTQRRLAELGDAGFVDAEVQMWDETYTFDAARFCELQCTFSPTQFVEAERRERLLRELARVINEKFDGSIQRTFKIALYTARRS